jgi:hypothetical protein
MSIDLTGVTGIEDDYGNVTKITDASGRVLWSATIKFTINGDTYIADRGMTWAEWFASDYNTTGETEGTIKDANGNDVSMDAVIVDGTAYEVGFAKPMVTITITGTGHSSRCYVSCDGITYYSAATFTVPVGSKITCRVKSNDSNKGEGASISLNGTEIQCSNDERYTHTIASDTAIRLRYNTNAGTYYSDILITES